jgi:hypothetical protein
MKNRHPGTSEYPWRPSRTRQLRLEITMAFVVQITVLISRLLECPHWASLRIPEGALAPR